MLLVGRCHRFTGTSERPRTPTGEEFGGIAATGREVRVPYSVVYDLQGEKIGAVRIYLSMEI